MHSLRHGPPVQKPQQWSDCQVWRPICLCLCCGTNMMQIHMSVNGRFLLQALSVRIMPVVFWELCFVCLATDWLGCLRAVHAKPVFQIRVMSSPQSTDAAEAFSEIMLNHSSRIVGRAAQGRGATLLAKLPLLISEMLSRRWCFITDGVSNKGRANAAGWWQETQEWKFNLRNSISPNQTECRPIDNW